MRSKILLINTIPASLVGKKEKGNMPCGMLSIATWITKNSKFDVKIIDCLVEENYLEIIKKEVRNGDILLAGLSVMSSCIPNALEITRLIKKIDPKIKIVWGGVHCKLYPTQTIKNPLLDFVVYMEGEKPLLNLAITLKKNDDLSKVRGIIYKKNGKEIMNPPEDFIDLNDLGILRYDLLNPDIFKEKSAIFYTSRGCPHRCTFCINVSTNDLRWRWLTPENVVKEIEYLIENYKIENLIILDECFFVNKDRSEKIVDLLIEKGLKLNIIAAARADYFTKGLIGQKLLHKMRIAGFYNVNIGIEQGSRRMLDFIKKDITREDAITSVKMLKEAGLGGTFAFMTGLPTEKKSETLETVRLIKEMVSINPGLTILRGKEGILSWRDKVRIAGPQVYRPYPGGELYDYVLKNYSWHTPESLEEWESYFKEYTRYNIEDYPWIEIDPNFYAAIQFYVKVGKLSLKIFLKKLQMPYGIKFKLFVALFYPFAKFRMSLNFFDFPIEYILGKRLGLLDEFET